MTPFLAVIGALMAIMGGRLNKKASKAYAEANQISQQALANIRTVAAFHAEERTVQRYSATLDVPLKVGITQGFMNGVTFGAANGIWFLAYGAAMYYGATQVKNGSLDGGAVMNVIFAAVIGGFALGQAAPTISVFNQGKAAAASLFATIDAAPSIDLDGPGTKLERVEGQIELRNVSFCYPARPDRAVFDGVDLFIPAGSTLALVGESGSGKSTIVQLIQRFYDPDNGQVLLDGADVKTLQLRWLRSQMGLVSQEPTLFATTIGENIAYGRPGATRAEVVEAAKAANAHAFISALPQG
jgi:ATP-binding cassette, subfamily B (MDR/TAP), member 1